MSDMTSIELSAMADGLRNLGITTETLDGWMEGSGFTEADVAFIRAELAYAEGEGSDERHTSL